MRGLLALLLVPWVVAAAAEEAGDAPLPGLHVQVQRPIVHRGGIIRARVHWVELDYRYHGEFSVRWQLRTPDGERVAHGRRPLRLRFEDESPYRFSISARAPRSVDWTRLTLEVAVIDDPSPYSDGDHFARGEATVSVQPGGTYWHERSPSRARSWPGRGRNWTSRTIRRSASWISSGPGNRPSGRIRRGWAPR